MIKVLSYNISWGSTTANITSFNDKSALCLAWNKCVFNDNTCELSKTTQMPDKLPTTCKDNIIKFIIALQEVPSDYTVITKSLNKYDCCLSSLNNTAKVMILYNKRFKSTNITCSGFLKTNGNIDKGRPFLIISLVDQLHNNNYLIINLHNGHQIKDFGNITHFTDAFSEALINSIAKNKVMTL